MGKNDRVQKYGKKLHEMKDQLRNNLIFLVSKENHKIWERRYVIELRISKIILNYI